jgi:inner membrane protein
MCLVVCRSIVEGLTPAPMALIAMTFVASDSAYQHAGNGLFPAGVLDEVAHLATAILILAAGPRAIRDRFIGPALIASVALDVDHIPGYLGDRFFTEGVPRPYTHSLLTIVIVLLVAAFWRRWRDFFLGIALGFCLHFLRDLAEGNGSGVALLWPVSRHAFSYSHTIYFAMMMAVLGVDAFKAGHRLVSRVKSERRLQAEAGSR